MDVAFEELFYEYRKTEEDLQHKFAVGDMDGLLVSIRLATQKCARLLREKGSDVNAVEVIGKIEGLVDAYSAIYNTIAGEKSFNEARAKLGATTFNAIVKFIYSNDKLMGVYHKSLADELKLEWGQLTELMKTMLLYHIVTATGSGKTTRYYLERKAIQYAIKDKIIEENVKPNEE